jgi:CubicO group peptidase (beta-lactamase class C family)
VRHLLNQTSGFPSLAANAGMVGGDMDEGSLERAVRSLAGVSLSQPVGSTYQYSNFNYWTLGMLVQAVSRQAYEAYLQQHVLDPLDMRRSLMSQAAAQEYGLASGYQFWFGVPVATNLTYSRAFRSTGGLISTAEDLSHYLVAHLNDGQYAGASVLSAAASPSCTARPLVSARPTSTTAWVGRPASSVTFPSCIMTVLYPPGTPTWCSFPDIIWRLRC